MIAIGLLFVRMLCDCFKPRAQLEVEILILRHQLNVLQQRTPRRRPHLRWIDRALFIWLYRRYPRILDAMSIVRPETVVRWHRKGFTGYWRWKSRSPGGRPRIAREVRDLIRRMSFENSLWGALPAIALRRSRVVPPSSGRSVLGIEAQQTSGNLRNAGDNDRLVLRIPWKKTPMKRRREVILPVSMSAHDIRPIRAETRATLVASIARGRRWLDEIVTSTVTSVEQIAVREKCSIRQVHMTISLAFLAPELVKTAVEGRLPRGIGVTRLRDAPAEWSRQYAMLGLSS